MATRGAISLQTYEILRQSDSLLLALALEVFGQNPLGKVPVLLRPDLPALFDSNVICAYFDPLHTGPSLIPAVGEAGWKALRIEALAQGMADAGIAVRWESVRRPPALRYDDLRDGYIAKLQSS